MFPTQLDINVKNANATSGRIKGCGLSFHSVTLSQIEWCGQPVPEHAFVPQQFQAGNHQFVNYFSVARFMHLEWKFLEESLCYCIEE